MPSTFFPSSQPSGQPSTQPSMHPSVSSNPSSHPSNVPSSSNEPSSSGQPSSNPSESPSISDAPSSQPSSRPSNLPSLSASPTKVCSILYLLNGPCFVSLLLCSLRLVVTNTYTLPYSFQDFSNVCMNRIYTAPEYGSNNDMSGNLCTSGDVTAVATDVEGPKTCEINSRIKVNVTARLAFNNAK